MLRREGDERGRRGRGREGRREEGVGLWTTKGWLGGGRGEGGELELQGEKRKEKKGSGGCG